MPLFETVFDQAWQRVGVRPRVLDGEECFSRLRAVCHVCNASRLDYESEVQIKEEALRKWWGTVPVQAPLEPLVASPRGRNYRVVSKRRAFAYQNKVRLGLIDIDRRRPFEVEACAIEPAEHAVIYRVLGELLNQPFARPLATALQLAVVKGNYEEFAVILNVKRAQDAERDAATTVSKALTKKVKAVHGFFLFEGENDKYYMEGKGSVHAALHRIWGKNELFMRVMERPFLFHPASFTQVNPGIAERMVMEMASALPLKADGQLFDLYCGYGLFTLCLAGQVKRAVGVELSPESVRAANDNAKRHQVTNVRFHAGEVRRQGLEKWLKGCRSNDVVILDPPRAGPIPGVIETVAGFRPGAVCHIFCNIDRAPDDLRVWGEHGYRVARAVPFDMFPGTPSIELMAVLKPMA